MLDLVRPTHTAKPNLIEQRLLLGVVVQSESRGCIAIVNMAGATTLSQHNANREVVVACEQCNTWTHAHLVPGATAIRHSRVDQIEAESEIQRRDLVQRLAWLHAYRHSVVRARVHG